MPTEHLPDFVQALLDPAAYPHRPRTVELVQTHISFVFLAGELVYKCKKPVDFGFLDFTTLEARRRFCHEEVRLNRRLCPDIYRRVVEVTGSGGEYRLGGDGETVEYAVEMARMPAEGMMGRLIAEGALDQGHLERLVDVLVPFYREAERSDRIDAFGSSEAVAVNVLENFEQTEPFVGQGVLTAEQFATISAYAREALAHRSRFQERIEAGAIRDCHGDLYSANVCFGDSRVWVFDCIEFNERFRYCDVASDVAFMAMDLDFHGLESLSAWFVGRLQEALGDRGLAGMLPFYKCYRAYVRGKISLFTAADPAVETAVKAELEAQGRRYFELAMRYAEEG